MSTLRTNAISARTGAGTISIPTGNVLYAPGHVIQAVQVVKTDRWSAAPGAGNFSVVTGFEAVITPKQASSKILVTIDVSVGFQAYTFKGRLLRNGATIPAFLGTPDGARPAVTFANNTYAAGNESYHQVRVGGTYLDSPNTTSPVAYTIALGCYTSYSVYVNRSHTWQVSSGDYDQCPVSTITLMEIAQ
jgi:hypothetical protein